MTTVVDQRGKSKDTTRGNNRNPMSNVQLEAVKAHIKSFNPGISHYRRKHAPHRLYLDPSLTIQDMFRDYKNKTTSHPVSQSTYYREVKAMNISFAKLGHEECEQCMVYDRHLKDGDCTSIPCQQCTKQEAHTANSLVSYAQNRLIICKFC